MYVQRPLKLLPFGEYILIARKKVTCTHPDAAKTKQNKKRKKEKKPNKNTSKMKNTKDKRYEQCKLCNSFEINRISFKLTNEFAVSQFK